MHVSEVLTDGRFVVGQATLEARIAQLEREKLEREVA